MARAYQTSLGTVVVENWLGKDDDEVLYVGYLLDNNGEEKEHSRRQLPRHDRGSEEEMRELRRYCVKCVISCYKIYLAQKKTGNKRRKVSFNDTVQVKLYVKDHKISKADKIREWDEFGKSVRQSGLCSADTQEDLMLDAMTVCNTRRR